MFPCKRLTCQNQAADRLKEEPILQIAELSDESLATSECFKILILGSARSEISKYIDRDSAAGRSGSGLRHTDLPCGDRRQQAGDIFDLGQGYRLLHLSHVLLPARREARNQPIRLQYVRACAE